MAITIPLDSAFDDSVVYREVFKYLKKNVAPELYDGHRYSWLHYSSKKPNGGPYWSVITAPAGQLTIEVFPKEHETVLALKYGLLQRKFSLPG